MDAGVYVTSLADVDSRDGSFRVGFFIWFNDPEGRFDIERDVYFIARSAKIDDIDVEPTPDGGAYTYARVEAVVPQEFDFAQFPFDRQKLVLRMEAEDPMDLRFVPNREDSGISDYLSLRGWTINGASLTAEDHAYATDFGYWRKGDGSYSQLQLTLDITRTRSPVLLDDFLGLTFAFLVTGLSFFVPCSELGLRIGMSTASLFAAVINVNRLHDAVGFRPEFALVDRLAFLVFGMLFASLCIAIYANRVSKAGDAARANRLDSRLGAGLVFVALVLILLTIQSGMT